MNQTVSAHADWRDAIYGYLKEAGVSIFTYVPDGGHKVIIERCVADPDVVQVPLTTEEEGVALAAGAHLGGARSVLLMQSSGVGNCINMLSLIDNGRFPFLAIVAMRGEFGEANPWQMIMGNAVRPTLEAMRVRVLAINTEDDVEPVMKAAIAMAFAAETAVAVTLSQRLLGAKPF